MVQKYLLAASSLQTHAPEFTEFYLENPMAGVVFRRATLRIIVINPL